MRVIIQALLLLMCLAACDVTTSADQPSFATPAPSMTPEQAAQSFARVVAAVEPVAESEFELVATAVDEMSAAKRPGLAASAAALTAQDETASPAATETETETRNGPIRIRNINGYAVLDRQHLVLRAGASRRYLVTLKRRCTGLRGSTGVGLSLDNFATIHNPHFEYVQTRQDRCYFDTIEQVDSNDEARALIAARAQAAAEAEADAESMR